MDDMIKDLHELCEMYGDWIKEAKDKLRRTGSPISSNDAEYLDYLTHSLKSIKTTLAMMESEDEGGYSSRYPYMPRYGYAYDGESMRSSYEGGARADGYGGMSNAGRRNAQRDSRGRYSSAYSYADDIDGLIDQMRDKMDRLPEEKRREVERFINKMDRM